MSDREVKTRQTFEEWYDTRGRALGLRSPFAIVWDAALASVILPEGEWADDLSKLVPWNKVRSTNVIVCAYDQTGAQVAVFGEINRPLPKTVELTTEEKRARVRTAMLSRASGGALQVIDRLTEAVANGKTIDQLCVEYGISMTRELS